MYLYILIFGTHTRTVVENIFFFFFYSQLLVYKTKNPTEVQRIKENAMVECEQNKSRKKERKRLREREEDRYRERFCGNTSTKV